MGLFRSKLAEAPLELPADLRSDMAAVIRAASPKEGPWLARRTLLNYLQEWLPRDEVVEAMAACCGLYGWVNGFLLLTDRRVITVLEDKQNNGKISATALSFTDIQHLSYGRSKRVIRNSPARAFADLHLIVSKVLISARRA
jgi:hypothetical protein